MGGSILFCHKLWCHLKSKYLFIINNYNDMRTTKILAFIVNLVVFLFGSVASITLATDGTVYRSCYGLHL